MTEPDGTAWQRRIDPARTAFFLDVDGTLLGFKDRPEDVVADSELIGLLKRLRTVSNRAVALVSGRMVSDLDRIMTPLVLPAAGVHGADLRFADGTRETVDSETLTAVRDAAARFVEAHDGLRLEDKGGSTFAIHFRQRPEKSEEVARFLDETTDGHELMVQRGKMVAEVKSTRCNKGVAIARLSATPPFAGRTPLFVGDDLTDEHGFEAVNEKDGVSIKVGDATDNTVAHYRLADIAAVRRLLAFVCRSVEGDK